MDGGTKHDPPLCHGAWALGTDASEVLECAVLLASCRLRAGMGAELTNMPQKRGAIRIVTDVYDWPKKSFSTYLSSCVHPVPSTSSVPRSGQETAALRRWGG